MEQLYRFSSYVKRTFLITGIILLHWHSLHAQTTTPAVNISVSILPPYSPYYADYSGPNASKVLLIITNTTGSQLSLKLTGQLEGDNGIKITTKSNYVPMTPIVLNPRETKQLNGTSLKDIFDLNSLNVYGIDKSQLIYSSRLPEGNYTFCVQAVDMATNQVVSSSAPLGCTSLIISYPEAPVHINPIPDMAVTPTNPTILSFTWINPGVVPANIQYILQVAEIPQGITDPNQVLNAVSFPLINKTVFGTNYQLLPSDPPLVIGKKYAWRVQAIDPTGKVVFKNSGKSMATTFVYGPSGIVQPKMASNDNIKLYLLNPNKTDNKATVTETVPMDFNWIVANSADIESAAFTLVSGKSNTGKGAVIDSNLYQKLGIKKFFVVVSKAKAAMNEAPVLFTALINEATSGGLSHHFKKTKKEALALGFKDGVQYTFEVQGLDAANKPVRKSEIVPFTFQLASDPEKKFYVKLKTQLRYAFGDLPGDYPVANTPVSFKIVGTNPAITNFVQKTTLEGTAETDADGNLSVMVTVLERHKNWNLQGSLQILNVYYGNKEIKNITVPAFKSDTNFLDIGKQMAKVFGYNLKLYVQKEFPVFKVNEQGKSWVAGAQSQTQFTYDDKGNLVYQVAEKQYEAGIPIRLYRKGKQSYVPPAEGTINRAGLVKKEVDVLVAEGKTQLETVGGVTKSFVKFEKLLCNLYEGDEYYALAVDATNVFKYSAKGMTKYYITNSSEQTLGEGYTATEKTIKFIPKLDITYSSVIDTYTILSNKPPQSVVSGRIVYKWKKNPNNTLRAYANQNFHVQVAYRAKYGDGSVEYLAPSVDPKTGEENYFVKDSGPGKQELVLLRDAGVVAGSGTTDATGRFTLQIDNLNAKGSVGSGSVSRSKDPLNAWQKNESKPAKPSLEGLLGLYGMGMEDPSWGTMIKDVGTYTTLPTDMKETYTNNNQMTSQLGKLEVTESLSTSGTFKVQNFNTSGAKAGISLQKLGGPAAEDLDKGRRDDAELERVFIIVPDNYHLWEADEPLVIQPFEAKNGGDFTSAVWETQIKVIAKNSTNKNVLKGMKVVLFRTKDQKFPNMPIGEGDNQYKTGKLISPQTSTYNNVDSKGPNALYAWGLYAQDFEKLWEGTTGEDGSFLAPQMFAGTDYYMQVTSDPTNGNFTFESYVRYVDRIYNDVEVKEVLLDPLPTRIAGRLVEGGNSQQPIAKGQILLDGQPFGESDEQGYFEVFGNNPKLKYPIKAIVARKNGYKDTPPKDINIKTSLGAQYSEVIPMQLGTVATGYVASKDFLTLNGKPAPVQSYIRRKNGAMVTTDQNGYYAIPIQSSVGGQKLEDLEIIPLDVAYFRDTITAHQLAGWNGTIYYDYVLGRRHRMNFIVERENAHGAAKAIEKVKVQVDERSATTDKTGRASFNFPNVSVNNYNVILTGDASESWIPKVYNVTNEESRDPVSYYVTLKSGYTISGSVTLDGSPVSNAKVYIDYKANSNGLLDSSSTLVSTRSGKDGKFVLKGVPIDPSQITLLATLDTNFTVVGAKVPATAIGGNPPLLALTSMKGMMVKSLHGFPISVESLKPALANDQFLVTGIVDLSKGESQFKLNEKDATVRVRDVLYKISGDMMLPVGTETKIEAVSRLSLKYLSKYNISLIKNLSGTNELSIVKNAAGKGEIVGFVKVVDNSFNYPGSYLNFTKGQDFYFGEKINAGTVNTRIPGMVAYTDDAVYLKSIKDGKPLFYMPKQKTFQISNAEGNPIEFKFIDFAATADPQNSYIAIDGKIHLNVKLDCHLPNAQPADFKVDLKDVVLDNDKVYPGAGSPIELKLEDWKLVVSNWTFDPQKGGIFSTNSMLKTSKLDIPIKFFNLRSDMMVFDTIDASKLSLGGGIVPISNVDTKNAVLVWDTKTGSDMSPHWRMSVAGVKDKPAAKLLNLSGLGNLDISYIQVLSNNESILSLAPVKDPMPLKGNAKTFFTPQTITNGPDFFEVNGTLDLKAPRMAPFDLGVTYGKGGQSFTPITTEFEGKGYVHFIAENKPIVIDYNKVTIGGIVQEKPEKSFEAMPGTFIADANGFRVDLPANHPLNLSPDGNQKFIIANGGMKVVDNDWSILSFNGKLKSKDPGIEDSEMKFNVYGDVQVDGSKIQTGSASAFGTYKMVYDFKQQTLLGTLNFPETSFGAYTVAGNLEMMIGSKGFYMLGSGKLNTAIPIVGGGYSVGFLIGNYTETGGDKITPHMWNTLQAFQLNKNQCFYDSHRKDFSGFYLTAGRSVVDFQKDFDFVLVAGYVEAKAAVELSIWTSLGAKPSIGASISAYGKVRAGMSSITGTSMSGSLIAIGAVIMKYENGFSLAGEVEASFDAHVKQSLLFTSISLTKRVAARLHVGTDGYSLEWSSGSPLPTCPPN